MHESAALQRAALQTIARLAHRIGDAFGLSKIGVNLTTLPPGKESAMRHWHTAEDELIYVVEGELILRTDDGEQRLLRGMCVGFRAGDTNGHHLINRGDRPARYLEVSNRDPADAARYNDVDLAMSKDAAGKNVFTHKDGSTY